MLHTDFAIDRVADLSQSGDSLRKTTSGMVHGPSYISLMINYMFCDFVLVVGACTVCVCVGGGGTIWARSSLFGIIVAQI